MITSGASPVVILLISFNIPGVTSDYIDCVPGTLNVILSAPHGGYETPKDIPDRVAGCWEDGKCNYTHGCHVINKTMCSVSTARDDKTKELTLLVAEHLFNMTGKHPHVVINNLDRRKMDANREIEEATFGDTNATNAYKAYHKCIADARNAIEADNSVDNRGLFIEMQGHIHPNDWTELGYLVTKPRLNSGNLVANYSSLKALDSRSGLSFETLVRGKNSFGDLLEKEGYSAVPSPVNLFPGSEKYFPGGHNTKEYGSIKGRDVDGIQIEASQWQRADGQIVNYAVSVARVIVFFLDKHY